MGAENKNVPAGFEKSSLVEIKKGKVVFKQKPISYDKLSETLHEIVKFREMLERQVKSNNSPLSFIPDEHKPVIVKLAQESDKSLGIVAKRIQQELVPQSEEGVAGSSLTILPTSVIEAVIKSCMTRINYGLDAEKSTAATSVWRWEVNGQHRHWLPKSAQEKAQNRLAERVQAKKDLTLYFNSLTQPEQEILLPKNTSISNEQDKINAATSASTSEVQIVDSTSTSANVEDSKHLALQSQNVPIALNPPEDVKVHKPVDLAKAAKEKEKLEKKAAKALKDQKEQESKNKSRAILANFFVKPKATSNAAKATTSSNTTASSSQTDFEKTFKPFVLKKDSRLAPINRFNHPSWTSHKLDNSSAEVIIIDDSHIPERSHSMNVDEDVSMLTPHKRLSSSLSLIGSRRVKRIKPSYLKTYNPVAVREIVSKLSEAEIAGEDCAVRELLGRLRNRRSLPAKVLIFATDARPGYYGTWTRSSRTIGPRTPLKRDILEFDYSYDSGEDWEDEVGGDADDVAEDEEDEDEVDEPDSDADSWLVDDDDEVPDVNTLLQQDDPSPTPDLPSSFAKRKSEITENNASKKRKVVIPLTPFAKGPCLETVVGHCESDILNPYRIQFFNDAHYSIDPFKFISNTAVENANQARPSYHPPSIPNPQLSSSSPQQRTSPKQFAVPAMANGVLRKQPSALTPKTPFPEAHLSFLLNKIQSMRASGINFLVDSLYQELKVHNIKKVAIEAKVREVAHKDKIQKVWVVRPSSAADSQIPPLQ